MRSVGVFAGPSLPIADRLAVPGLTYLPPAARGDVAAAAERFDALLLIDGVFHQAIATSAKEMLAACRRVPVFGASSMGALRAVECRAFGAIPLGAIAGWYASGAIDGDDEVAVLMDPATSHALSVPSVNVRYVARLATRRGVLSAAEAGAWANRARREIFYADRSWRGAVALAPAAARDALLAIAHAHGDLKRWDARFAVRRVQRAFAA
jgi:hypothetical protein